jgi:hypothetical protein
MTLAHAGIARRMRERLRGRTAARDLAPERILGFN